ncbi:MAG: hypothetical protein GYB31_15990 [Bacteroidetes bacterium]|nr:hypothetical protein [Bacteroidota bacterium]
MERFLLFTFLLLLSGSLPAQIENGSFEIDGEPDLLGWIDQCNYGNSVMDAPVTGGEWCLELQYGNTQGCFPAYFYQILEDIPSGTWLEVQAMVRTSGPQPASLILGKINLEGQLEAIHTDTLSSNDWALIETSGLIELNTGELAVVMLQAGFTGGPVGQDHYAWFDEVEITDSQNTYTSEENFPEIRFPNPVSEYLPLWTDDGTQVITSAMLFTSSGNELLRMQFDTPQSDLEIYLRSYPNGPYYLLLFSESGYKGYWILKQ